MQRVLLSLLAIALSFVFVSAQTPSDCPSISVTGPNRLPKPGQLIEFTADIRGAVESSGVSYVWSVSADKSFSGQGTNSILIEFPDGFWGLTATVEVIGLPQGCPKRASETLNWDPPPDPVKIAVLRSLKPGEYETDFEKFWTALNENADNQGIIFIGHSRDATENEIKATEKVIYSTLYRHLHDASRITFVRSQSDADIVELWRVPPGANNPDCEFRNHDWISRRLPKRRPFRKSVAIAPVSDSCLRTSKITTNKSCSSVEFCN